MLSNTQIDEIDDQNILNILDSLHNETTVCENEEDEDAEEATDYDSALVYECNYLHSLFSLDCLSKIIFYKPK